MSFIMRVGLIEAVFGLILAFLAMQVHGVNALPLGAFMLGLAAGFCFGAEGGNRLRAELDKRDGKEGGK